MAEFRRIPGPWRAQPSLKLTTTSPGIVTTAQATARNELFELYEIKYAHVGGDLVANAYREARYRVSREPFRNWSTVAYFAYLRNIVLSFEPLLQKDPEQQRRQNVVGRFQEERQSGDDPGDDEDGTRGEDVGQRLRGRGTVRLKHYSSPASTDNSTGGSEQWRRRRTDCRRKPRAISTVSEVRNAVLLHTILC